MAGTKRQPGMCRVRFAQYQGRSRGPGWIKLCSHTSTSISIRLRSAGRCGDAGPVIRD